MVMYVQWVRFLICAIVIESDPSSLCTVEAGSSVSLSIPVGTSMRGACSSIPWVADVCGSLCLSANSVDNGTLTACGNGSYCCDIDISAGLCSCSTGSGAQYIQSGYPE